MARGCDCPFLFLAMKEPVINSQREFNSYQMMLKLDNAVKEQSYFFNTKRERDQSNPDINNALYLIKHGRTSKLSGTLFKAAKSLIEEANDNDGFIDKDTINRICKHYCPRGRVYERWLSDLLSKLIKKNILSRINTGLYQLIA